MLKRTLRRLIVATSVPPIAGAYRLLYRAAIRVAAYLLTRGGRVLALYLCRGCAKREIVPGLSDIDFVIVARAESDLPAIRRTFHALARWTRGVIEYYPRLVMTRETLERRWRATPIWRYRFQEGRSTWERLHGIDLLHDLPPLSREAMRSGCYVEMARWWLLFAAHVLGREPRARDPIVANAICYKAVAELRNARHALDTGEHRYSRAAAFDSDDSSFGRRLVRIAEGRFLARDERLADDTFRFLVDFFLGLWGEFPRTPYLQIDARCAQSVDAEGAGWESDPPLAARVRAIAEFLERSWGVRARGLHVVRSAFWDFEDRLVIVDVDANALPAVDDVAALVALHRRLGAGSPARTVLFLRAGEIALPLTPVFPRDLHRGIATPATAPDVFLQLGVSPVYWTDLTRWYLADWRGNEQWVDASPEKRRQLEAIERGAARGAIVYPLTREALDRLAPVH